MTFRKTFALFAAFAHAGCTTKNSEKVEKTTAVATEVLKDAVAEHVDQEMRPYLESLVEAQKEEIDVMKKDIKSLSEKFEDFSESTKRFAESAKQFVQSDKNPKSANTSNKPLPLEYKPRLMLKQDKDQNKNEITFNIDPFNFSPKNSIGFSKFAYSNRSFNQNLQHLPLSTMFEDDSVSTKESTCTFEELDSADRNQPNKLLALEQAQSLELQIGASDEEIHKKASRANIELNSIYGETEDSKDIEEIFKPIIGASFTQLKEQAKNTAQETFQKLLKELKEERNLGKKIRNACNKDHGKLKEFAKDLGISIVGLDMREIAREIPVKYITNVMNIASSLFEEATNVEQLEAINENINKQLKNYTFEAIIKRVREYVSKAKFNKDRIRAIYH